MMRTASTRRFSGRFWLSGSETRAANRVHRPSAEVAGGLARVSESVPFLGVHSSKKTSTTAVAKMPAMDQIDGICFWPYIATSL
jgi:hypothetical protein